MGVTARMAGGVETIAGGVLNEERHRTRLAERRGRPALHPRLRTVLADQGYKGWLVEFAKRWFGIIVDIVQRPAAQHGFVVQPQRWKIERTFGWLYPRRILSKEYERTTESSKCDVYLASIRLMLRRLGSGPT
jgi:transposase